MSSATMKPGAALDRVDGADIDGVARAKTMSQILPRFRVIRLSGFTPASVRTNADNAEFFWLVHFLNRLTMGLSRSTERNSTSGSSSEPAQKFLSTAKRVNELPSMLKKETDAYKKESSKQTRTLCRMQVPGVTSLVLSARGRHSRFQSVPVFLRTCRIVPAQQRTFFDRSFAQGA